MANTLTAAEKASLVAILAPMTIYDIDEQLTYVDSRISSAIDTKIKADIATWDATAQDDHVKIRPNERNFGADIDPDRLRSAIRKRIAGWLFIDISTLAGAGRRLQRG